MGTATGSYRLKDYKMNGPADRTNPANFKASAPCAWRTNQVKLTADAEFPGAVSDNHVKMVQAHATEAGKVYGVARNEANTAIKNAVDPNVGCEKLGLAIGIAKSIIDVRFDWREGATKGDFDPSAQPVNGPNTDKNVFNLGLRDILLSYVGDDGATLIFDEDAHVKPAIKAALIYLTG